MTATRLPPGPRAPRPWQSLGWVMRPGPYAQRLRRRYGDTFTLRTANEPPWVVVSHPDDVRRVFTGDPDTLCAGEANAVVRPVTGPQSVIVLDGDAHLRRRRALLPSFHGPRIQAYGELIAAIADAEAARWPAGEVRMRPRMQAIALEVIMRAVLGSRDERLRAEIARYMKWTTDPARVALMVVLGPDRATPVFRRARRTLEGLLLTEIARRRREPNVADRPELLAQLIAGTDLDDAALADELIGLLLAGHETTAAALAWALERLAHHPDAWERLHGGDEAYLDAVVKETLRLRPPIAMVQRVLHAPLEITGRTLPAGVAVTPSIALLHTRADLYPEPYAFRPERFLESPAGSYTWIPFGGGVRRCLGASFATFEMKAVLRAVSARIEPPVPGSDGPERTIRRAIVLVPEHGARVIVTPLPAHAGTVAR